MELESALKADKNYSIRTLDLGFTTGCADYIMEIIVNLEDGTCGYGGLVDFLTGIARTDWYCYFDEYTTMNDFDSLESDPNRKVSFKAVAEKAKANILDNFNLPGGTIFHEALKCNNNHIIKTTLNRLKLEGSTDVTLIPILEKIARKDVYRSYFMHRGLRVDCHLGELAREVIDAIRHPEKYRSSYQLFIDDGKCSVCGSLGDELTVKYGSDEQYPEAYRKLVQTDHAPDEFKRCPSCDNYFYCVDSPQEYGSGNNAEETIERFSKEQSQHLHNLFTGGTLYSPSVGESEKILEILPLHQLLPALWSFRSRHPNSFTYFVSSLVKQLSKLNDKQIFDLLLEHVNYDREHAKHVLNWFKNSGEPAGPLMQKLVQRCSELFPEY